MIRLDTHSTAERKIIDLRPLHLAGPVVLGRYHYTGAHPGLPLHRHEGMMEICYLAKGTQTYQVGSENFHLRGGDVFVTFPNEPHGTGRGPEEKGDLYWLILDTQPERAFLGCDRAEGRALCERLLTLHPRQFRGAPMLKAQLDEALATFEREDFPFRKTAVANAVVRFLLQILDCARRERGGAALSPEIADALAYIENHLTNETRLGLAELAQRASMSLSRFKARFRSETGIPPAEYVVRRKIERAAVLLEDGRAVTKVAFELGFSSSQHFATVFRRLKGTRPCNWLAKASTSEGRRKPGPAQESF